jgi:hypothetical protein
VLGVPQGYVQQHETIGSAHERKASSEENPTEIYKALVLEVHRSPFTVS